MNEEEYLTIQMQLGTLAGLVSTMDLAGFLNRITHAQTMGPILNPTLYRKAAGNLEVIEELARAFFQCQQTIERIKKEYHIPVIER